MDMLASLLRRHDIPLTVAVYPWPDQVRYDSADSIQVVYWREWAERRGVQFIDLLKPPFRASNRDATIRTYYVPGDVHFNKAGSKMIASSFLKAYHRSAWPRDP